MFTENDIISVYTRQDAIEDGILTDLTALFPEEAKLYRFPVACTESVWLMIETAVDKKQGDLKGIVWNLLYMSQKGIVKKLSESTMLFQLRIGRKNHTLKVTVGGGDNLEPVVTILMEGEE
jgi:hypothetical protein